MSYHLWSPVLALPPLNYDINTLHPPPSVRYGTEIVHSRFNVLKIRLIRDLRDKIVAGLLPWKQIRCEQRVSYSPLCVLKYFTLLPEIALTLAYVLKFFHCTK